MSLLASIDFTAFGHAIVLISQSMAMHVAAIAHVLTPMGHAIVI